MNPLEAPPTLVPISDNERTVTSNWERWFVRLTSVLNNTHASGTTAQRPLRAPYIGFGYFDTTLNKPVFASAITTTATTWRDAAGTVV